MDLLFGFSCYSSPSYHLLLGSTGFSELCSLEAEIEMEMMVFFDWEITHLFPFCLESPTFMSILYENLPLLFAVWKSWNCLDISWIYLSCMLYLLKPKECLQLPSGLLLCKVRFIAAPKSSVDTFVVVAMVFFLPRILASPIEVGRSTTQVSSIPPKYG